jgi:hypothetical protein
VQQSPEVGNSLFRWRLGLFMDVLTLGWGWGFSLAVHFTGFLRWTGIITTFIGGREQSWEHFAHQPCGKSTRLCISSLGCRNAGLQLLRMQECYCPPWGMGYSLICLRSPDPTIGCSIYSIARPQQWGWLLKEWKKKKKHPEAVCRS